MKLNICYPALGSQKPIDIDDENKLRCLMDKRISQEVEGDLLGDEFKGYVFRITGGNDKQGFPMKQGVLCNYRVRLLLADGMSCYRARRDGERKRKSVRGCIVGSDICVLNLMIVKKGEKEIPGLTDEASAKPRRLGPKRASHIRQLFGLSKKDDVRKFVVRRQFEHNGHKRDKAPKIQRLVTHLRLCHKRANERAMKLARENSRQEAAAYKQRMEQLKKEKKEARSTRKSHHE